MLPKTSKQILKKVTKTYGKIAEEFSATRQKDWDEFKKYLKYIKNGNVVLDIGCGNGRLLAYLKQHRKIKYFGIDNSPQMLKQAKKAFPRTKFIKGDLIKIPIKADQADVVCEIASFHHLPTSGYKKLALREAHRVLKENGILIISVWNLHQKKYKKYIWRARLKSLISLGNLGPNDTFIPWSNSGEKRYYHAFTPKSLRRYLEQSKFEILEEHIDRNLVFICRKSKY